jgi:hypothetical protein
MTRPQWNFDEMRRNARIDHTGERLAFVLRVIDDLESLKMELAHVKGTIYAVRAARPKLKAKDLYRLN